MEREYKVVNGLNRLWVAKNITDNKSGSTYGEPIELENLISFGVEAESTVEPLYASNKPLLVLQSKGGGSISIEMAGIPKDLELMISGATEEESGFISYGNEDVSPYVGVIAEFTQTDGSSQFIGLPKVVFSPSSNNAATKTAGSAEAQTETIEGQVFERLSDNKTKYTANDKDVAFNLEGFFTTVFNSAGYPGGGGNPGGGDGSDGGDGGVTDPPTGDYDDNGIPNGGGVGLDGALYDAEGNALLSPEDVEGYVTKLENEILPDPDQYLYKVENGEIWSVEYDTDLEGYRTGDILDGILMIPTEFTVWYDRKEYDYTIIGAGIPPLKPEDEGGGNEEVDENGVPHFGGIGTDGNMYNDIGEVLLVKDEVDVYIQATENALYIEPEYHEYESSTGDVWRVSYTTDGSGLRTSEIEREDIVVPGNFTNWVNIYSPQGLYYDFNTLDGSAIPPLASEVE